MRPKNVVISVGPNNYGHPTAQALALYRQVGAAVYRTDLNGTVTVQARANGTFVITTEPGTAHPGPVVTPAPARSPAAPTPAPAGPYYRNCTEARAAGAAPLRRGQPGYRSALDRDEDGVGCE